MSLGQWGEVFQVTCLRNSTIKRGPEMGSGKFMIPYILLQINRLISLAKEVKQQQKHVKEIKIQT